MPNDESVRQALELVRTGQKARAYEILKGVLVADSNDLAAWAMMALVAENRQEAIECLKQVLRLKPNDPWATQRLQDLGIAPSPAAFQEPAPAVPKSTSALTGNVPTIKRLRPKAYDPGPQRVQDVQAEPLSAQPSQTAPDAAFLAWSSSPADVQSSSSPRSYSRLVPIALLLLVCIIAMAIGYVAYDELVAEYPDEGPKAIQAARVWTEASYTMDFGKRDSLTCGEYTSQPDILTGLLTKKLEGGLQSMVEAMGAKPQPPSNLIYTTKSIKKSEARVKVAGFMSELRSLVGPGRMDEDTFRQLDERVYIMRRENGEWKWCGYE